MSFPVAFYRDLDEMLNSRIPPLLDNLFEVFLTSDELDRSQDRSRRFKVLMAKLFRVIPDNITLSLLRHNLRDEMLFIKQTGNILRHYAPTDSGSNIQPHTMKKIIVDFGFTLDLLIGIGYNLLPSYQIVRELQIRFHQICNHHKIPAIDPLDQTGEIFVLSSIPTSLLDQISRSSPDGTHQKSAPSMKLASDFVPPISSVIPLSEIQPIHPPAPPESVPMPQGRTLTYYKSHGFISKLRKKKIFFLRGIFAHRPCCLVRTNGKNSQCFFPDDQSTHYIPNDFELQWMD